MFAAEVLDLVQIAVRRGMEGGFAAALQPLGLTPPEPGEVRSAGGCDLIWLQPNTYLLAAPRGAMPALVALAPCAALVEQSDGRSAFILSGPRARDVLAQGCRLDFHPRAFGPGRAAGAALAHVNAVIQRLDRDRPASSAGRESPDPDQLDHDRPASSAGRESLVPDQLDRDRPASSAGRESPDPDQLDRDRPASSAGRESPVLDDRPAFRIIVFSSFAQHIAEWLAHATVSA